MISLGVLFFTSFFYRPNIAKRSI